MCMFLCDDTKYDAAKQINLLERTSDWPIKILKRCISATAAIGPFKVVILLLSVHCSLLSSLRVGFSV